MIDFDEARRGWRGQELAKDGLRVELRRVNCISDADPIQWAH